MSHPADVVAASRGILTSNLARERRYRRAHGMVLELRSLREQLQEWPGEELNTIRGALLEILKSRGRRTTAGNTSIPATDMAEASDARGNNTAGEARWLHERHHGMGNAPGSDLRSPTEIVLSDDSPTSRRRRRMHGAFFSRHGPIYKQPCMGGILTWLSVLLCSTWSSLVA